MVTDPFGSAEIQSIPTEVGMLFASGHVKENAVMNVKTIYLIRHGKTKANIEALYYGSTELLLEEQGIEELKELKAKGIYPVDAQKYYLSGMHRTVQTMGIIYPNAEYETVEGLRECDLGTFELKTYDELKDNADYIRWINDETGTLGTPGGETRTDFKKRVLEAFEGIYAELEEKNIDRAAIVFHGGPIVRIMERYSDEKRSFADWQPINGMGYALRMARVNGELRILDYTEIKGDQG